LVERKDGIRPSRMCWAALSNRYRMQDTEAVLKWLYENGCEPDPDVCKHMDINRPYASLILDFVRTMAAVRCGEVPEERLWKLSPWGDDTTSESESESELESGSDGKRASS